MFKKLFSALILSFLLANSVLAFSDVNENHIYYNSINYVEEQGIVEGYSNGQFKPDKKINRAEMMKIIVEAFYDGDYSQAEEDTDCFLDLDKSAWYSPYICFAKSHHIVNGYSDGSFKPGRNISFVEALKITLIASGHEYLETDPWYKGIVETASSKNYIPITVKTFSQEINRGEMADMIARIMVSQEGDLSEFLGENASYRITYDELKTNTGLGDDFDPNEEVDVNNPPSSGNCDDSSFNSNLMCFFNKHRAESGLSPLVIDENLNTVAQKHSEWMNVNKELTHTADNKTPFDRCEAEKVECNAENIAMSTQVSAETFYKLWIESPSHNKNILGDYKTMGAGLSGTYATTLFAK